MRKPIASFLLLVLITTTLFAWGPKGHQIVGDIAQAHLNNAALQGLHQLLGADVNLAALANWADDVKAKRPESYGWHFVDIPKDANGFDQARDCYKPDEKHPSTKEDHHNCVVDRINMFKLVLANKSAPREERIEALKYIVHFVGDIHQPLHAIAEARGGNDIHVVEFGSAQCGKGPCNFHYSWDIALLEHSGRSEQNYVAYLEQQIKANNWHGGGTPEDWANESLQVAKQVWLPEGGALDEAYYKANIGILDQRLALAGLRLADLLNDVFSAEEQPLN